MDTVNPKIIEALNEAFAERYHSLARYVLHADPYVSDEDRPLLAKLQKLSDFDKSEARRLAKAIDKLGGIPHVTPIAQPVTELNYASISFLNQYLRNTLRSQFGRYESYLAETGDVTAARDALQRLCSGLSEHLSELEQ